MTMLDALVKPMLRVALFRGLRPHQIARIARSAERIVYRPGDTIIECDSEGCAAVLIVSGDAVRVSGPGFYDDPEPIESGSLVGEMAMLVETLHASTVIARGNVRALRFDRDTMRAQMESDPSIADHFLHKIAGRLTQLAGELRDVDHTLGIRSDVSHQAQLN